MVGLEELICDSDEGYAAKAIELAGNPVERQRIREHLLELSRAPVPVYFDMPVFASRVGGALERLCRHNQDRYSRLATDAASLRETIEEGARRLIGTRLELNALTGAGIMRLLVDPYFDSPPAERFLSIETPGENFEALESIPSPDAGPELVLVGLAANRLPASTEAVNTALARMAGRGFGAIILLCEENEALSQSAWRYRLSALHVDRLPSFNAPEAAHEATPRMLTGWILFHPTRNPKLPLMLQSLLDCCDDPRRLYAWPSTS